MSIWARTLLAARGLHTELRLPDDDNPIGGVLEVWQLEDEEGDPVFSVEVVNFTNPHRPGRHNPGGDAVRNALPVEAGASLRYVRLADLIALKLYSGSRFDKADVVELLVRNPDADLAEIEAVAKRYDLDDTLRELAAEARAQRH